MEGCEYWVPNTIYWAVGAPSDRVRDQKEWTDQIMSLVTDRSWRKHGFAIVQIKGDEVFKNIGGNDIYGFIFNGHGGWGGGEYDGRISAVGGLRDGTLNTYIRPSDVAKKLSYKLAFVWINACCSKREPWESLVSKYRHAYVYDLPIDGCPISTDPQWPWLIVVPGLDPRPPFRQRGVLPQPY
jgi:hypothetical protein